MYWFSNIDLQNLTLVTASELNVKGGRIWAHERRKFWFTDLSNNHGLPKIRWKERGLDHDPTYFWIYCASSATFRRKERYTIQKSDSSREKDGYCLVKGGNRKQLPYYSRNFCRCKINGCWNYKRNLEMFLRYGFWIHSISENWEGSSRDYN